MTARLDLHRARLLVRWLQARRAQQEVLDALLAYGPVAEQRIAERLDLLRRLELVARARFDEYLAAATQPLAATPGAATPGAALAGPGSHVGSPVEPPPAPATDPAEPILQGAQIYHLPRPDSVESAP